jgi:hypothetical protein
MIGPIMTMLLPLNLGAALLFARRTRQQLAQGELKGIPGLVKVRILAIPGYLRDPLIDVRRLQHLPPRSYPLPNPAHHMAQIRLTLHL